MATSPGTLEVLARQAALAFQPLKDRLASGNVITLFAELGLEFPQDLLQPAFENAVNAGAAAVGALPDLITALSDRIQAGDDAGILQAGTQLLQQIGAVIASFEQISTELKNLSGSLPGMAAAEVSDFADKLPSRLLGYILISYLRATQPGALGIGNLLGITDYLPVDGIPDDPTHPPYIVRELHLSRIGDFLKSPLAVLKTLYGWGDPSFDGSLLFPRLRTSLGLLNLPVSNMGSTPVPAVEVSLFTLVADSSTNPPGLLATLTAPILSGIDLTIPLNDILSLRVQSQGAFVPGLTMTITPPAQIAFHPTATLDGLLQFDLAAEQKDADHPIIIVGQTGGSRLQTATFSFGAGLTIHFDASTSTALAEPLITAQVTGGKMVIDTSNADGFLSTVLAGVHVEAGFDLKATWAPDVGIHFEGGAQLEINLPLHLSLGPVTLSTLYLVAGASTDGIPLEISAALGLTLGPFQASVDRLGVKGLLTFPDHNGNLGPANLAIAFKPPNGLGIAIDAGVVAGGGFISFNPDKGQYAGVLDVELAGIIQVKVIGILDTILPDGSHGFSFLLIITFEMPPIQLSFGFTLNGVGGIASVNRTMSVDALRAGQRAHTLDSIMFPPDPIVNAPQIISNLRSFFPPATGRYVFGPMLELGWGTPTLITLSLGVILELADPVRLVILGLIDVGLPTKDVALIALHIDVLGTIDFAAKKLAIDGSLYDSHVLIYSLSGDLAMRLCWGSEPNFVFSLGGFNPHFNTAALDIPKLNRMSLSIGDGDNPRISSNAYFAITSNTLQFGANTEAYASAGGFGIHGYLGFDTLIIYSPFSFEFDFKATFDVSFEGHSLAGLDVDGTFTGPTPWHLHAHASIHILWWSIGASLTLEWGDSTAAILPKRSVLADLIPALQDPRNWSAALPEGTTQAVSLASPKPGDKILRVHPMGTLTVRETVVPLDLQIARYGNSAPSDGSLFAISNVTINTQPETKQNFQDFFAAGQFLTLSDADKLSRPSFERYDAGANIGSAIVVAGADSPRTVMYEERYIDVPTGFSRFTGLYAMPASRLAALTQQGAGFLSAVKNTGLVKYLNGPASAAITSDEPAYVVASVDNLAVRSDIAAAGGIAFFAARAALTAHLASHPEDAGNLQIIPIHEVAA